MKRKEIIPTNTEILWKKDCKILSLTGKNVLERTLCWPEPEGKQLRSVRKYYQTVQERFRNQWEKELYLRACMDLVEKEECDSVFVPWQARLMGEVTWQDERYFSIAMTVQEEHGDRRILEYRWGDVWYWEDGCPVRLRDCTSGKGRWKRELFKTMEETIEVLRRKGICFDSDGGNRIHKYIASEHFALTQGEIIFYCPQCTVAPAVEGVLELKVPRPEA